MPRDIERRRATARQYLRDNPEYAETARVRARVAMDRKRMADPVLRRKLEIYEYLVKLQGGDHCAICKVVRDPSKKRLAIDHDHVTDEIRGLLCSRCNRAIGNSREGIEWLQSALAYLERVTYTGLSFEEIRTITRFEYGHLRGRGPA
jgi:CHASE3 domain sensor protein